MTSEIRRIRSADLSKDTVQTAGMVRAAAIERDGLWSGIATAAPKMASGWHHHGDNETVIYVLDGAVHLEFGPGGKRSVEAQSGDFIHVPPRAVHRESNPHDREAHLVVTRAGSGPATVNVEGPDS
ncbi:MAG TPA: cupin domain-containing protein [Candidatus Limnocylindria bacterium]|nr:cupin domain-containing protein [Candidatus Limnocylindria bacterium]